MSKTNGTYLLNMRREELYQDLLNMESDQPNRVLYESLRTHFNSHLTMPGEKELKDRINQITEHMNMALRMGAEYPPKTDLRLTENEKEEFAKGYAETRIRETKLEAGSKGVVQINKGTVETESGKKKSIYADPAENSFKLEYVDNYIHENGTIPVQVSRIDAELRKVKNGVNVYAKNINNRYQKIGSLPSTFLTNNPMFVESCKAEITVEDFSNGKLRNVSERLIVDNARMSGDVVELNDDMLAGLDNKTDLKL